MTPLKPMDFAYVTSNKVKGSGLVAGDKVLIAGTKVAPVKRSDPYLQRIYVVVMKIEGDKLLLPRDDNDYKVVVMDPRALEKMNEEESATYTELMIEQFSHDAPS